MKVNFGILLSGNREEQIDDNANIASIFPSESDIISAIYNIGDIQVEDRDTNRPDKLPLNGPCIVVWDLSTGRDWFVGMVRDHL